MKGIDFKKCKNGCRMVKNKQTNKKGTESQKTSLQIYWQEENCHTDNMCRPESTRRKNFLDSKFARLEKHQSDHFYLLTWTFLWTYTIYDHPYLCQFSITRFDKGPCPLSFLWGNSSSVWMKLCFLICKSILYSSKNVFALFYNMPFLPCCNF
jgi:hypothetical protein